MPVILPHYKLIQRKIIFDFSPLIYRVLAPNTVKALVSLTMEKSGSLHETATFFEYLEPTSSVFQKGQGFVTSTKVASVKWAPTLSSFSDQATALVLESFLFHLEALDLTHFPELRRIFPVTTNFANPFLLFKNEVHIVSIYKNQQVERTYLTAKQIMNGTTNQISPDFSDLTKFVTTHSYTSALNALIAQN